MIKEYDALLRNEIWELTPLDFFVGCKQIFRIKRCMIQNENKLCFPKYIK